AIMLINAKTGETQQIDISPNYSSYDSYSPDVRFSSDSKLLAYTRIEDNWNLAVWVHDIAANKNVMVSDVNINSYSPYFTGDGKYLAFLADREFHAGPVTPTGFGVDNTTHVTLATLSPDTTSPFLPKNDEEGADGKTADAPKPTTNLDGIQWRTI